MLKWVLSVVMVQSLYIATAAAISYKSNDKFQFNDSEGDQIAYLECSNLKAQDTVAIRQIVKSATTSDVAIEGLIVKKQKIAVMYSGKDGTHAYEFDSYKSGCDVSIQ